MKRSTQFRTGIIYVFAMEITIACSGVLAAGQAFSGAKVATIQSDMFSDPKAGVTRLIKALATLETEVKPRRDELARLSTKADSLTREVQALGAAADPKLIATKADQIDQIKLDFGRKQEDAQKYYDRRFKELTSPIFLDISKSLEAYMKKRQIDVVFDISKMTSSVMLVNAAADITTSFIAEYNAKLPTP
jgi:Skp family chaperone for outer membrane proteins